MKICVFTKMGLENDRYRLQKGPKKPFCGCFGPNLLKLVNYQFDGILVGKIDALWVCDFGKTVQKFGKTRIGRKVTMI